MKSEAAIQQEIRLASWAKGSPLLRNNNGACYDDRGRLIRYGLGNDSAKMNAVFKSSDLIGVYPLLITQDMVGGVIGQFMAVEVKASNWQPRTSDKRYLAQKNFGDWVIQNGGRFMFAKSVTDVWGE